MDLLPFLKAGEEYFITVMGLAIIILSIKLFRSGFQRISSIFLGLAGLFAFLWKLVFIVYGENLRTEILSEIFEMLFALFVSFGIIFYVSDIYEKYSSIVEEKQNFLQTVIDGLADAVLVIGKDYRIKLMNRTARNNFLNGKIVENDKCHKIFHELENPCNSIDIPCPLKKVLEAGQAVTVERTFHNQDGAVYYFENLASPFYDVEGRFQGMVQCSRDISKRIQLEKELNDHRNNLQELVQKRTNELNKTNEQLKQEIIERVRAEEALLKSEEKYRGLIENIQDGVFLIQDAQIKFANNAFARMVGYTLEELIGKHIQELIAPEDLEMVTDRYFRRQAGEKVPESYEFNALHKDGKTRVSVSMSVGIVMYEGRIGSLGTVKDITERIKSENALIESEKRFRNVFENAKDVIYTVSSDGKITSLNPAFEKITGWSREEWLGKDYHGLINPDHVPLLKENIKKLMMGENLSGFELHVISRSGTPVILETTITLQSHDENSILGIAHDITERKKLQEIRIQNERLLIASKAKSEFFDIISHEVRTPLTSIIGFSELLIDDKISGELNDKQEHFAGKILANGKHLLDLVNDILDLSKLEAGKMQLTFEKFPVYEIIDETIDLMKELAEKRNVVIIRDYQQFEMEADRRRIKQVLLNLISNSVKFSKEEGGLVTISSRKSENSVIISVIDTGIGIKEKDIGRLFWTFEQLDSGSTRKYGGSGLGLVISKKLVELHGGTIKATSKFGEGSTFSLTIPLNNGNLEN